MLTDKTDPTGEWLADALARRLYGSIVALTGHDLVRENDWAPRFDDAAPWFRLRLTNGLTIDSREVRGVINRLRFLPAGSTRLEAITRPLYARGEIGAILARCFATFACPVLNPSTAQGLRGAVHAPLDWAELAQRAGFTCVVPSAGSGDAAAPAQALAPAWDKRIRGLPTHHVLVIGERVLQRCHMQPLPDDVAERCLRLAALAGCPLLGLSLLQRAPDDWHFRAVETCPDLMAGGSAVVDAIAAALTQEAPASTTVYGRATARSAAASIRLSDTAFPTPRPAPEPSFAAAGIF